MLSRDEVYDCQKYQLEQCGKCLLKPEDEYCPYVWCLGEIKMGPCHEFMDEDGLRRIAISRDKPFIVGELKYEIIKEYKDRVYKKSEKYARDQKNKKPFRRIILEEAKNEENIG